MIIRNMIRMTLPVALGILLLCGPLSALDPRREITQYKLEAWGLEEGLPQNTVEAMTRTPDGYLWLATQEGLARFDGVRFDVYNKTRVKQLKSHWMYDLLTDRQGNLWAAVNGGGVLCCKNGEFTVYTTADGLLDNRVWSLCEGRDGSIWVGSRGGLNRVKDGVISSHPPVDGAALTEIISLLEDKDGVLWIGTEKNGLFIMGGGLTNGDRVPPRPVGKDWGGLIKGDGAPRVPPRVPPPHKNIRCLLQDRAGNLWIGSYGGGLLRYNGENIRVSGAAEGLDSTFITALYEDEAGVLWVGSDGGGLYRMKGGRFTALTRKDGLTENVIKSLYRDPEGSLWIGTDSSGLNRLRDGKFVTLTRREGLGDDVVDAVYQDRRGVMWFATYGGGVSKLENGVFTHYTTRDGLSSDNPFTLCDDPEGAMWVGTGGQGLNRIRDGKITVYTSRDGLNSDYVWHIINRRAGGLWIATDNGVTILEKGVFKRFPDAEALSGKIVACLYEDRGGALWLGCEDDGLIRVKNGEITAYTTRQGLSGNNVVAIHEDGDGSLWLGAYSGLNRLKDGVITPITTADGLFDHSVFQILEDDAGDFWMSCNNGIFRTSRKELDEFCDGRRGSIRCVGYNERDGMKSRECNGGYQPVGFRTRDGGLWFATIKGAVMIHPAHIRTNPLPPPVTIETITTNHLTVQAPFPALPRPAVFPAGTGRFEFKYTGLSFIVPESVRFRCRLDGVDETWRDMGGRRTAHYTKLSPGKYTFRVTACNNDGVWNETGAEVSFYLEPFFHQTWWFYVLVGLGAAGLTAGFIRLRMRQVTAHKIELEHQVRERTRQLTQAYDEVRREREAADDANRAKSEFLARMSHELRTPMNGIIGFTEILMGTPLNDDQKDYVRTIAESGDALTRLLNDILDFSKIEAGKLVMMPVDFDPRRTVTDVFELLTPRLNQKPVTLTRFISNDVPGIVTADEGRFRQVLVNLLGNAVKFTEKGTVALTMKAAPPEGDSLMLHVTVSDTGPGIPADKLDTIFAAFQQADGSYTRAFEGTGLGLAICRQIARLMAGDVRAESTVGAGSTFHFTARVQVPAAADTPAAPAAAGETENHDLHVLLVEDNPINQKLARHLLTNEGIRVTTANNGLEAVEIYGKQPNAFDMIFMDVRMPQKNGLEATKEIREMERGGRIPIVAMTAQSMKGDREICLEAGMDDYIAKPIKKALVLEMLKKWGGGARPPFTANAQRSAR